PGQARAPAYLARETRKAYSVSRASATASGLDMTRAVLGRQRAEATALPNWVKPQLAKLVDQPPDGPGWLHEIKFDGTAQTPYRPWRDGRSRSSPRRCLPRSDERRIDPRCRSAPPAISRRSDLPFAAEFL